MATGPSTAIALLSLADAKVFLGSTSTTDNDGNISDLINAGAMRFETETGRKLKSRDYTELYDGDGKNYLYLNNWPLSSTTITITIDSDRAFSDTDDQVTSTDIILTTEAGKVELDNDTFDRGLKNVKVEYTAGYTTDVNFDLVFASKEYLRLEFARQSKELPIGVRNENYEGMSRSFENDLPWSVKKVLDIYRDRSGW